MLLKPERSCSSVDIRQCLQTFLLSNSGEGRNCYQWKEARDVAKHPQCIPSSTTKNYLAQILDTAETEKPWARQRTFRAGVILCVSMKKKGRN